MGLRSHRRQITARPQGHGSPPDPLLTGSSSPLQSDAPHRHPEGRRPRPHRRCIHGNFPPAGTQRPSASGIRTSPRSRPPWQACNPPPHLLQVCMERSLHRCHSLGESLPRLPAGQGPPPRSGTSSTHPGTLPPFQPHPRGPGRPSARLQRFHSPVHHPAGRRQFLSPPPQQ